MPEAPSWVDTGEPIKKPDGQIDIFNTEPIADESQTVQPELFEVKKKYEFENPMESSEKEDEFSKHTVGLYDDVLDKIGEEHDMGFSEKKTINNNLDSKKSELQKQSRDRVEKLKGLKLANNDRDEDFRDKWNTPAYIRRNINLQDVPHSSEKILSKFNLNDEKQITGNNKFLHDKPD